jgi:hypothetical protein
MQYWNIFLTIGAIFSSLQALFFLFTFIKKLYVTNHLFSKEYYFLKSFLSYIPSFIPLGIVGLEFYISTKIDLWVIIIVSSQITLFISYILLISLLIYIEKQIEKTSKKAKQDAIVAAIVFG